MNSPIMNSPTMKDVAKAAEVSLTTVSHVINKTRFISEETRQKVLKCIKELNYQANAVARSLRKKTTNIIGVVVSDISNPYFTEIVRGCEDAAYKNKYNTILCNSDEDPKKEKMYVEVLLQKQVDGLIITPTMYNEEYFAQMIQNGFPIVFFDRYFNSITADYVIMDDEKAAYEAVSHLIKLGHREIGIIINLPGISSIEDRLRGYERALKENGIPFNKDLIVEGDFKVNGGYEGFMTLLSKSIKFSAVFVTNNLMTIGTINAIRDNGLNCPDDIAVVGYGDFEWASSFKPYLTVISMPAYQIGEVSSSLLISKIKKKQTCSGKIVLQSRLIVRESCGRGMDVK